MKVAVLGAGGKAGKELVKELRRRGHEVIATGRSASSLPSGEGIETRVADLTDAEALAKAVDGAEAVISALTFNVTANTIFEGMKKAGIGRLIVIGGASSLRMPDGTRIYDTPGYPNALARMVLPGIHHLDWMKLEQDVNWSYFSPGRILFEGERLGKFRLDTDNLILDENGESRISYADAAIAMVDELEQNKHPFSRWHASY
ncbi:NAD(P)-dependent oxidoreductase [Sphingopyxis flava]|uniref:NAD(P)-binding domain-containing protein n=1 Tax=Sphingopyxis flava TaxID=1507287 RepID=A0A1T5GNZ6_9SPHN|nr:NAD(P)H-binding protein [Sphingopyxis flava]SKC10133.1 hypothetical protein SAMN06295937_10912 [Sphingopyxis flava]